MKFKTLIAFIFLLLSSLYSEIVSGQAKAYCDSLIKKGIALSYNHPVQSLEILTRARQLADKNRWDKQRFDAILNTGNNYLFLYDYGEAINHYLEAYTIAVKGLGKVEEFKVTNNIATIYRLEKHYDKSIEYYSKALELVHDDKLSEYKATVYLNIGSIYNELNQPRKALAYLNKALPVLPKSDQALAERLLIQNDLLLGKTAIVRKKALAILERVGNSGERYEISPLQYLVARSYAEDGKNDLALQYVDKALSRDIDLNLKKDFLELLSGVYYNKREYAKGFAYKDSVTVLIEKIDKLKNGRLFESSRVKFEVENYKRQIKDNEERLASGQRFLYAVVFGFIATIIISFLVLRHKKLAADRNRRVTELNLEIEKSNSLELEKKISDSLLEQERLKSEIEARNRTLSAKALYLSDRNKLIEKIVAYMSKKIKYTEEPALADSIRSLRTHIRLNNEWDDFIKHFEQINHGFLARLKQRHPLLTANDVKFIAYIYMNLSVKEIAYILSITIEACKKRKLRLSQKLELENEDVFSYIVTI